MNPTYFVNQHQLERAIYAVKEDPESYRTRDVFLQTDDPGVRLEVEKPGLKPERLAHLHSEVIAGRLQITTGGRTGKQAKEQYSTSHGSCYLVRARWPFSPGDNYFPSRIGTFLLTWNPSNWPWPPADRLRKVELTRRGQPCSDQWSTGSRNSGIWPGDRVFLLKLGPNRPKGCMGSGYATSRIYPDAHWDDNREDNANYVAIVWDTLLDPDTDELLVLPPPNAYPSLSEVHWTPETSGTQVHDPIAAADLETVWRSHLDSRQVRRATNPAIREAIRVQGQQHDIDDLAIDLDEAGQFEPKTPQDARERVLREVALRQGQPEFRRDLLRAYGGRCAVTGCDVAEALEAAHIEPWADGHPNSLANGLLLRGDVHALFDRGLLRITADGHVELGESIRSSHYAELHGRKLQLPVEVDDQPSSAALASHRAKHGGERVTPLEGQGHPLPVS